MTSAPGVRSTLSCNCATANRIVQQQQQPFVIVFFEQHILISFEITLQKPFSFFPWGLDNCKCEQCDQIWQFIGLWATF